MPISVVRSFLRDRFGLIVNRAENLYPWQSGAATAPRADASSLPAGASDYLSPANPRLTELVARYAAYDPAVTSGSVWSPDKISPHDLQFFRGDNPYVFQARMLSGNEMAYALTYYHALAGPESAVLNALSEDGAFGAHVVPIGGRAVSRDLLDSAGEIAFLAEHVGLGHDVTSILDIGAGYGRLVHRLSEFDPNLRLQATDAFPVSTFLSEYYLRYRKSKAIAVPLDEVDLSLAGVQLATNVHSFSECQPSAIDWWTSRLARHGVRYLMVIPNQSAPDNRCLTNAGEDMDAIFATHGYRLKHRAPRYSDPIVQKYGVDSCLISLFELG